jgi:hypothetical protein
MFLVLKRDKFPIKIAFTMTISKAQEQTFKRFGVYLQLSVFSIGQLYMTFSRASSFDVTVELFKMIQ